MNSPTLWIKIIIQSFNTQSSRSRGTRKSRILSLLWILLETMLQSPLQTIYGDQLGQNQVEPISDELLTPYKYNEEEECTPLKVLCNVDQEKIYKPKSNPIYPTEVPKPSVLKLTKETEVSRLDSARESITEPITEEIHKPQTHGNTDHIPGHTKEPHKDVKPATNSPEPMLETEEPVELPPGQVAMPAIPESRDVLNFPVRAPLHSNLTEESGIIHGLPTGEPIIATETSYIEPLAQPSILIPDDLPRQSRHFSFAKEFSLVWIMRVWVMSSSTYIFLTARSSLCSVSQKIAILFKLTEQRVSLPCSPLSFEPEVSESIVYEPPVHKAPTDLKELNLPEASYPINCDNRETDVTLATCHPKKIFACYPSLKPSVIETTESSYG